MTTSVTNLDEAVAAYWSATSRRENQAAYHEILLFGGHDGWSAHGSVRKEAIRWLRGLAAWLDRE